MHVRSPRRDAHARTDGGSKSQPVQDAHGFSLVHFDTTELFDKRWIERDFTLCVWRSSGNGDIAGFSAAHLHHELGRKIEAAGYLFRIYAALKAVARVGVDA